MAVVQNRVVGSYFVRPDSECKVCSEDAQKQCCLDTYDSLVMIKISASSRQVCG